MPGDYIVRYGSTRNVAEFSFKGPQELKRDDAVLIRSNRGTEWGEILCPATDRTREYLGNQEQAGRILRIADEEARQKLDDVRQRERDVFDRGRDVIREHKLNMTLVDVECVFGGERIIFYYLAEQRVDFRELVKDLARRLSTRIEMRQIGVRDEAKLLADFGDCGKPVCCGTHLREMPPVSMKMAKMQKATLDPNKISGRCGRLKCCLRYEFETYEEYRRELPNNGSIVLTKQGQGKVIGQEILAQKVLVVFEGGRRILVDRTEIVTVVSRKGGGGRDDSRGRRKNNPDQSPGDRGESGQKPKSRSKSGPGSPASEPEQTPDTAQTTDAGSGTESRRRRRGDRSKNRSRQSGDSAPDSTDTPSADAGETPDTGNTSPGEAPFADGLSEPDTPDVPGDPPR